MKLTILIDLDETLLGTNEGIFLPAYFSALSKKLDGVPPKKLIAELFTGTQKMVANVSPALTLEEAFDQSFYPAIGKSKESLQDLIGYFYQEEFPKLKTITTTFPEAKLFVKHAFQCGHRVVIATSPLFPRTATLQRLEWAGLNVADYPFEIVSTFEDFHFSKPNPAYYTELLAQLGWPEDPVIMIGNSLEDDILPAITLGIPVYYYSVQPVSLPKNAHPYSSQGDFSQMNRWLDKVAHNGFENKMNSVQAKFAILVSTPAALSTICKSLHPSDWNCRPKKGAQSIYETINQLLDCEKKIISIQTEKLINNSGQVLNEIFRSLYGSNMKQSIVDGNKLLREFCLKRIESLSRLNQLLSDNWAGNLKNDNPGENNLQDAVSMIAAHDQYLIRQICNITSRIS